MRVRIKFKKKIYDVSRGFLFPIMSRGKTLTFVSKSDKQLAMIAPLLLSKIVEDDKLIRELVKSFYTKENLHGL